MSFSIPHCDKMKRLGRMHMNVSFWIIVTVLLSGMLFSAQIKLHGTERISNSSIQAAGAILQNKLEKGLSPTNCVKDSHIYMWNLCRYHSVPRVTGLLETAELLYYSNQSLIRFGDGEVDLMLNRSIPFQKANAQFAGRLWNSFTSDVPSLSTAIPGIFSGFPAMSDNNVHYFWKDCYYLTKWFFENANPNKLYFNAHISSPYVTTYGTYCEILPLVYKYLRQIWKDKDIVLLRGNNGQKYEYDVYDTARSQTVFFAPPTQSWSVYEKLKEQLLNEDPNKLYIIAAGPISKVLVYDLVLTGRRALDLGHLAKDYNLWMHQGDILGFFLDWEGS